MQKLGHPRTWKGTCFVDGGCGKPAFGHTNGHGDFVLLDKLGDPWPVHECYRRAMSQSRSGHGRIAELSRQFGAVRPEQQWELVRRAEVARPNQRQFRTVGTVMDVRNDQLGQSIERLRRDGNIQAVNAITQVTEGRRSVIRIVDVEGLEYQALFSPRAFVSQPRDIVGVTIRARDVLGQKLLLVTGLTVLQGHHPA